MLRQEAPKFQTSLGYTVRLYLKEEGGKEKEEKEKEE
jgi:hypothetical protein